MILKINPIVYDIEKEYFKQSSVREEQRTGSFTNRQHTQKRDNQPYTRGSHCQNLSLKRHFRSYLSLVKATYDRSQQPFAAMFTRHISSLIKLACTHSSGFFLIKISLPLNVLHFVFRFIGPRISQQYIITL